MRKVKKADSTENTIRWDRFTDKRVWGVLLGIERPWRVSNVELEIDNRGPGWHFSDGPMPLMSIVHVRVSHSLGGKVRCPRCGASCVLHDYHERSWRHLDTMQFATLITAEVPRVKCKEHGIHPLPVPWAEESAGFTEDSV